MNPVVIGGGFAGLAAACRLAGDGHPPTLFEQAPRLGGRAASFHDSKIDETIDYGQHVVMRCCTYTTGFLHRIGMEDHLRIQPSLSVPIRSAYGATTLRSAPFPGPLHLLPSLLRYTPIPAPQRRHALIAGLLLLRTQAHRLESVTFGDWLSEHRQTPVSVARLWDPICIATLNAPAHRVSAAAARMVFSESFFRRGGADLGCFAVPLSAVTDAAKGYIVGRGGSVQTQTAVRQLRVENDSVTGVVLVDGTEVTSSAVVCGVPPSQLARLLPDHAALSTIVSRALKLDWSPIVNVHLWLERPVMTEPFFIAVDAPIQAVFDVTQLHDVPAEHGLTHMVISQSAAQDWLPLTDHEILEIVLRAMGSFVPTMSDVQIVRARVLRQLHATFIPAPGSSALRSPFVSPIRGLTLAGDWTATGWPSTLESAVRSGIAAAARVVADTPAAADSTLVRDAILVDGT